MAPNGRLIIERDVRKDVIVVRITRILDVLEDCIKVAHASAIEETDVTNHSCHASSSESATRKSNQNDFISRNIIRGDESIRFSDVLQTY